MFKKVDTHKLILYPTLFGLMVIYSIFQVGLDVNVIATQKFWLELLLKYLLQVLWAYFGYLDGKPFGKLKQQYIDSKTLLEKAITLIKDKGLLTTFGLFVKHDYKVRREQYVKDILFANGIPLDLYELPLRDIKVKLNDYSLSNWHYYLIKKLKQGNFDFEYVEPQVYLSAYEIRNEQNQATYNERKTILSTLVPRMMITLLISALGSAAIITDNFDMGKALWDTFINISISIASYAITFRLAVEVMEDYAKIYDIRRNYISKFIESHDNGSLVKMLRVYEVAEVVK
jgi:hypothetical protein